MKVAVLVPRREDGGRRDKVWKWIRENHWDGYGWAVYEGHDPGTPFNRARAINLAARAAGSWDVAIIADSDSFVDQRQLLRAVTIAQHTHRFVKAYDRFAYLDEEMSDRIMEGFDGDWEPGVRFSMWDTCSSMIAVHRSVWDEAKGFDPFFTGWGFEDVAFAHACRTFGGGEERIPGTVWHLYHEPSDERRDEEAMNVKRAHADRYHAALGDRRAMAELIAEVR